MLLAKVVLGIFCMAGIQTLKEAPLKKHLKGAEVRLLADPAIHGNKEAFIAHLTVPPKGKVPLHQDEAEEYLFVLSGEGKIWIDGKAHKIKKDDLVYMPAKAKVKFENGLKPFKVMQVFAPQGPEKKYNSWSANKKATQK